MKSNTAKEVKYSFNKLRFQFLTDPVNRSMYLTKVDASEVHKIVQGFGNKATQDTKIEALKIANTSYNFTSTFAKIVNKSFEEGVFPEQMKIGR